MRKLAGQEEFLSSGSQSGQDELPGMQVKGDVAGLCLLQSQLLQCASRKLLHRAKTNLKGMASDL